MQNIEQLLTSITLTFERSQFSKKILSAYGLSLKNYK